MSMLSPATFSPENFVVQEIVRTFASGKKRRQVDSATFPKLLI